MRKHASLMHAAPSEKEYAFEVRCGEIDAFVYSHQRVFDMLGCGIRPALRRGGDTRGRHGFEESEGEKGKTVAFVGSS